MNPTPKPTAQGKIFNNAIRGSLPAELPSHAQARGLNDEPKGIRVSDGPSVRSLIEETDKALEHVFQSVLALRQEFSPVLRIDHEIIREDLKSDTTTCSPHGVLFDALILQSIKIREIGALVDKIRNLNAL